MKTVFLIAGEVSGDTHGAELMRSLTEIIGDVSFSGLGGSRMNARSENVEDWLDEAAVLGLWEVLKNYGYFRKKMDETIRAILEMQPGLVVPIDYPGFNLRLAKALRKRGYRGKIAYYISPQVWAWKRGRIREMARTLDLMLCIFPFEKDLYEKSGLTTEFVGHPLLDELESERLEAGRDPNLVGLFPGSRMREIEALFPAMLGAARLLHETNPDLRFASAAVSERHAERLRELVREHGVTGVTITRGDLHELMQTVSCAAIASGTATLDAAYFGLPYCLVYKVAWLTAWAARRVVKVPYLGIVNNLAGREVVRELLQENATARQIAAELRRLLEDDSARDKLSRELLEIAATLGEGGAHLNAARAIAALMDRAGS